MTGEAPLNTRRSSNEAAPPGFRALAEYITRELGIKMSDAKVPMLQSRLARRLRALGLDSLEQYHRYLVSSEGAAERPPFFDAVTTNKTDFFREPQHFRYLVESALPSLDPGSDRFWNAQVWSAGCSSGEEAYTIAMTLGDFGAARQRFDFSILATDISQRVLQAGMDAIYEKPLIAPIPEELRKRYLLRSRDPADELYRIVPALRSRVRFSTLNLVGPEYRVSQSFEAIFFRNVMIYFDKPTQERVVCRLCRHLRPGGYLFIGHSESLAGLDVPVRMVAPAVYRQALTGEP
ncbi:chemotaxis protein CheR [Opitutaceae bacterium EW11]|nr:chemotaxis protein CheR [Opitutaceae bacterium EW11]